MIWEPQDDVPPGEWIVYDEIGAVIGSYGQDEYRAKEVARSCGGRDLGITVSYVEMAR